MNNEHNVFFLSATKKKPKGGRIIYVYPYLPGHRSGDCSQMSVASSRHPAGMMTAVATQDDLGSQRRKPKNRDQVAYVDVWHRAVVFVCAEVLKPDSLYIVKRQSLIVQWATQKLK